jgi:3-oxoacyl-[acyl-carrier protein] reductase
MEVPVTTEIDPEYLLDLSLIKAVLKPDCLAGRRALVTGARFCSIGSAAALALHSCGAEIAIHAESSEVLDPTCDYFDKKGIKYNRFLADFSEPEKAEALGHQVLEECGPIDILAHVAGITLPTDITRVTIDQYQFIHNINCTSAVMLTKSLLPGMLERKKGNIVFLSSIHACRALSGHYFAYAMTKAAMEPLARYLAVAYGQQGMTAHVLLAGIIDNERHRLDPDVFAEVKKETDSQPAGYLATPIEVGANIAMLCTDLGNYSNGGTFVLDGGRLKQF